MARQRVERGGRSKTWLAIIAVALVAAAAVLVWRHLHTPTLPDSFASANGRIEATEIDIATERAGRVAQVLVEEGDMVAAGEVLARMDTEELEAELREAEAQLRRARAAKDYAVAFVAQRESELVLADKELTRLLKLVRQGHVSQDQVDQNRTNRTSAEAALKAARVQVVEAEAAIEAAVARTEKIETYIDDSVLQAPVGGRVLYRLAQPGEVLAAGGKVLTLLELTDVYMTIFLPTHQAIRVALGADARIVFDARPDLVIPAKVSFVAPEAQFTPKQVETRNEREKLMFRIKVRIDPELLQKHIDRVKTGVPGVAYVRLSPSAEWPEPLQVRLPE